MLLVNGTEIIEAIGMWRERTNAKKTVCVLMGTTHSFEHIDYLRTVYNRISKAHYDVYRLTNGWKIHPGRETWAYAE
jgi:hypothetical protein